MGDSNDKLLAQRQILEDEQKAEILEIEIKIEEIKENKMPILLREASKIYQGSDLLGRDYFIFPNNNNLYIVDKNNVYGFDFDQIDLVIN